MSTQIKRLQQQGTDFVPITLSEAVVVNCNNLPGFASKGITTLERVLNAFLGIIGMNSANIEDLVKDINDILINKQDKLTAGNGIEISPEGVISSTFSTTLYVIERTLPSPSSECLNKIYLIPTEGEIPNVCNEYICIQQNGNFYWELIGQVASDVDISGYITTEAFKAYVDNVAVQLSDVTFSDGKLVEINYDIPNDLYDYLK